MGGGGGVTGSQKNQAAGQLANISKYGYDTSSNWSQQGLNAANQVTPYYTNMMKQGLPFYNNLTDYASGANAQAFAPQRAALLRQTSQYSNLPSGYRNAMLTNLGAQQARSFDSTMTQNMMANQMAKNMGASGLTGQEQMANQNALGYLGVAGGAAGNILQAQQKPSTLGTIGGALMSAAQIAAMA